TIPPDAELQFGISTLESQANATFTKPPFYSLTIEPGITGLFQHVVWHPANGTLTNLSTCDTGTLNDPDVLLGVHTSLLQNGFPATVVVYNTGTSSASVSLGIFDALSGNQLGTYNTPAIAPNSQAMISVPTIESSIGFTPGNGQYHYVVQVMNDF